MNRVNSRSHLGKNVMVGDVPDGAVFESNMMRFRVDARRCPTVRLWSSSCRRDMFASKFGGFAKDVRQKSNINHGT